MELRKLYDFNWSRLDLVGSSGLLDFIDRGIFEVFGPTGISNASLKISLNIHKLKSGYIYHYTLCDLNKYLNVI